MSSLEDDDIGGYGIAIVGNQVMFSITAGAFGDDDLVADGSIVDQGGPGALVAVDPVPALGNWALLLLACLMAGLGAVHTRRFRA